MLPKHVLSCPCQSAYISPIENLKDHVYNQIRHKIVTNLNEPNSEIQETWSNLLYVIFGKIIKQDVCYTKC